MDRQDLAASAVTWYSRLVGEKGSLQHDVPSDKISQGFLVCAETQKSRVYALFGDYISYARYSLTLEPSKRCFYEVVLGSHAQKPHFDLDFDDGTISDQDVERRASLFVEAVISTFAQTYGIDLNLEEDVLIFTSHSKANSPKKKRSFHIIIDNYCHSSNVEAKEFYKYVLSNREEKHADAKVYSKTQQFRLAGSHKMGSGRYKTLREVWTYQGRKIEYKMRRKPCSDEHRLLLVLEASALTYVGNCTYLRDLVTKERREIAPSTHGVSSVMAMEALVLLAEKGKTTLNAPNFPYIIREYKDNCVLLNRVLPSRCLICKRIHDKENPFFVLRYSDEFGAFEAYFHCRRSEGESYLLGLVKSEKGDLLEAESLPEITEEDVPVGYDPDRMKRIARATKKEHGTGFI